MPIQPSAFPGIFIRTSTRATQDGSGPALQQLASRDSGRALLRQIEAITAMAPRKRVVLTPPRMARSMCARSGATTPRRNVSA